jgi:cytochrome c peroxidase
MALLTTVLSTSSKHGLLALTLALLSACGGADEEPRARSQAAGNAVPSSPSLQTLRGVTPPDPAGTENGRAVALGDYVVDRVAAVRLGKALFWDMNLGSDGNTACATCHFKAGADGRIKNQINPGSGHVDVLKSVLFNKPFIASGVPGDIAASSLKSGRPGGPNAVLGAADFPLHVLADPLDRNSAILYTTDDVIGSQGVFDANFVRSGQSRFDDCTLQPDAVFKVGSINTRRTTARNSPSVINAALNVRNFWDGRANNVFNGFSPFGNRDPDAGIWVAATAGASLTKVRLALDNASAASQAVGPPGSDIEMSCGGRSFANIARRVLDLPSLNRQAIDPADSVLGVTAGGGRKPKYRDLVQAAFAPRLWDSVQTASLGGVAYSQIEANFPLFFGLAIQMYESTLLSDQAPLDAYLQGNANAIGAAEARGLQVFTGKGQCINCHGGPELTNAASRLRLSQAERVERMAMADGQAALYDNGFYNIGVRPTVEDIGLGATDPWGLPLSFTRQYGNVLAGGSAIDAFAVDVCSFDLPLHSGVCDPAERPANDFRDAVDGAFKVPGLRNVALTGPYFHNGSRSSLEQVVAFYDRGGDRRGSDADNTSRFGTNGSNLDADIKPLALTAGEAADLVAFMKNALTDPRVAWERAPFDHPSLVLPDGHIGDTTSVAGTNSPDPKMAARARDVQLVVPAVGRDGRAQRSGPLEAFDAQLK